MAKVLTDKEMLSIVTSAIDDPGIIDDANQYMRFVGSLGELITEHFGGIPGGVDHINDGLGYTMCFSVDENVPADGGVFKEFDTDITWRNGEEVG